ncbi:MAG TPA: class I SAM-dependent methyltransferase [Acidimicrobiales bacterium]|nr:class I SAM-dependent methyltransferase [Acidimicrobiales bacterium]
MTLDRRAALAACWSFKGVSVPTRAFLVARVGLLPLGALDKDLRSLSGAVLSVGCGHGVLERYLSLINDRVTVTGVELDGRRVAAAARSQDAFPRVTIKEGDATADLGHEEYDVAMAVDVMHHVPFAGHHDAARALFASVRPGGICLVKDLDVTPRWKYQWNKLHDRFVNHAVVHCRAPSDLAAVFGAAGFRVEGTAHIDRALGPYPHYLVRLRKPA